MSRIALIYLFCLIPSLMNVQLETVEQSQRKDNEQLTETIRYMKENDEKRFVYVVTDY